MMTSDDKVGGWVKKGQNHDDVILEWSLSFCQSKHSAIYTRRVARQYGICRYKEQLSWRL
jgi:hypothetical protein